MLSSPARRKISSLNASLLSEAPIVAFRKRPPGVLMRVQVSLAWGRCLVFRRTTNPGRKSVMFATSDCFKSASKLEQLRVDAISRSSCRRPCVSWREETRVGPCDPSLRLTAVSANSGEIFIPGRCDINVFTLQASRFWPCQYKNASKYFKSSGKPMKTGVKSLPLGWLA